jgi:hypothetical protein
MGASLTFWQSGVAMLSNPGSNHLLPVDHDLLQIAYQGKTRCLGSTLPFRLLGTL